MQVPYEAHGAALGGRSFHHGRFVQRLRQKAQAQRCVQLLEATAVEIIENKATGRVLGVTARLKATGHLEQVSYEKHLNTKQRQSCEKE